MTGFAELKIYDDFAESDTYAARVLWGLRLIFLSLLFGLWAYQGFGTACLVLLILSLVFYSVSSKLGQERIKTTTNLEEYRTCFYVANISIINWVFAIPFSMGSGKHRERACWLCLLYTSPSPRDKTVSRMPSSA